MNRHRNERLGVVATAMLVAVLLSGCASYRTRLGVIPGGHLHREHAKPIAGAYYRDFDPRAATIEITPVEGTNPVKTQHILIATVRDADGNPLSGRRVEWIIPEGSVGAIVEVDESGWYTTRGHKVDNKYAVSHTNWSDHVLNPKGTEPPAGIKITQGQTWCVITSPIEGSTHIIAYAPAIYRWDKHKVFAVKHWSDLKWDWPPAEAVNPIGTPHTLTTKVTRFSDGSPLEDYDVTYRIASGPAATLAPGGGQSATVKTDAQGLATVTLNQTTPAEGVNAIEIEVVRPAAGDNPATRVSSTTTTKTWIGPKIAIAKQAPATALAGQQFDYTITVSNPSEIDTTEAVLVDTLPDGIRYVSSQPQATVDGQRLTWTLGTLTPGQQVPVRITVEANRTGRFVNPASVTAAHGLSEQASAETVVMRAALTLEQRGPDNVLICDPIAYSVVVRNTGDAPARNVRFESRLPEGLVYNESERVVTNTFDTIGPGESKTFEYSVTANRTGAFVNSARVVGENDLSAEAETRTAVQQPMLVVTKVAPGDRLVGTPVTFEITVKNDGDGPARNTVLEDALPRHTTFRNATEGGRVQDGKVVWNLGTLAPGQSKTVSVTLTAEAIGSLENLATASATCSKGSARGVTQIRGIAALLLEMVDVNDPIAIGEEENYIVTITNQGSSDGTNIVVVCEIPAEQEFVSAEGATRGVHENRRVTFAPVRSLAPGAKAVFTVVTRGLREGDTRFRASVTSDQIVEPVVKVESTHVYSDR